MHRKMWKSVMLCRNQGYVPNICSSEQGIKEIPNILFPIISLLYCPYTSTSTGMEKDIKTVDMHRNVFK